MFISKAQCVCSLVFNLTQNGFEVIGYIVIEELVLLESFGQILEYVLSLFAIATNELMLTEIPTGLFVSMACGTIRP